MVNNSDDNLVEDCYRKVPPEIEQPLRQWLAKYDLEVHNMRVKGTGTQDHYYFLIRNSNDSVQLLFAEPVSLGPLELIRSVEEELEDRGVFRWQAHLKEIRAERETP